MESKEPIKNGEGRDSIPKPPPMPPTPMVVTQWDCNCCGRALPNEYVNFHFHVQTPVGAQCTVYKYHIQCWLLFEDHIRAGIIARNNQYDPNGGLPNDHVYDHP